MLGLRVHVEAGCSAPSPEEHARGCVWPRAETPSSSPGWGPAPPSRSYMSHIPSPLPQGPPQPILDPQQLWEHLLLCWPWGQRVAGLWLRTRPGPRSGVPAWHRVGEQAGDALLRRGNEEKPAQEGCWGHRVGWGWWGGTRWGGAVCPPPAGGEAQRGLPSAPGWSLGQGWGRRALGMGWGVWGG